MSSGLGYGFALCVMRYLNGTIGDKVKNDITCTLVVPGENYNGRRVVDFCTEKVLRVCDKYFKYKYICK